MLVLVTRAIAHHQLRPIRTWVLADATPTDEQRAMAVVGVIAGVSFTVAAARSVAEPLGAVRDAMARVGKGDLDVEVSVHDRGEVGLLQAGFTHMATGLQERQRLADLFGRHVGEDVARQALADGVRLGGEQREITALVVDLVGSTELAETTPAAQLVELLNRFFDRVRAACASRRAARERLPCRPAEELVVRGLTRPLTVHELEDDRRYR